MTQKPSLLRYFVTYLLVFSYIFTPIGQIVQAQRMNEPLEPDVYTPPASIDLSHLNPDLPLMEEDFIDPTEVTEIPPTVEETSTVISETLVPTSDSTLIATFAPTETIPVEISPTALLRTPAHYLLQLWLIQQHFQPMSLAFQHQMPVKSQFQHLFNRL